MLAVHCPQSPRVGGVLELMVESYHLLFTEANEYARIAIIVTGLREGGEMVGRLAAMKNGCCTIVSVRKDA